MQQNVKNKKSSIKATMGDECVSTQNVFDNLGIDDCPHEDIEYHCSQQHQTWPIQFSDFWLVLSYIYKTFKFKNAILEIAFWAKPI